MFCFSLLFMNCTVVILGVVFFVLILVTFFLVLIEFIARYILFSFRELSAVISEILFSSQSLSPFFFGLQFKHMIKMFTVAHMFQMRFCVLYILFVFHALVLIFLLLCLPVHLPLFTCIQSTTEF